MNVLQEAAQSLRKAMKNVDYGLDDSFCDSESLKKSWEGTGIPDEWLTFYSSLFGIRRMAMVKEHMTQLSNDIFNCEDDVDDNEVFEDDDNEFRIDDDEENLDDCSDLEDEDDEEFFYDENFDGEKYEKRHLSSRLIKEN